MSFEAVSERLTALQESNKQLKTLIERLATIKFQPGSIPLENDEDNAMGELSAEIHQTIKDQDDDFELLQEEVFDLDTGKPGSKLEQHRDSLAQSIKRSIKELRLCETAFRKAQIEAKKNLKEAQRAERRLLLETYTQPPSNTSSPAPGATGLPLPARKSKAELTKEERELAASSDVTAALRQTHDRMAEELQKSQFAHDTLKESTAALAQLSETYSTLDTLLSSSKNLLGTLLRSQKSDTWYLETAFYILAATVAWLVFRRILYGPLYYPTYWLFWFLSIPLKMFMKGWLGVFAALGLTGGQSAESGVTSVVSSIPTVSHRTAGKLSAPSGARTPPGVNVGGGGKGAPVHGQGPSAGQGQEGSVSEQVGRIIDESKAQGTEKEQDDGASENETAEQPRNPQKRMWEEDKEAAKEEQRKKDEL